MTPDEAGKRVLAAIKVNREDIARAKVYVLRSGQTNTSTIADEW